MKNLYKFMLLPAMVLPLIFTSCDEDRDDNPTTDFSHVGEQFVLNTPANAENNTYDLASAQSLQLTCSQPNYGTGVPYFVRYYVQASIDPAFEKDTTVAHTELTTAYTSAKMDVNASELNDAVVKLFKAANPDEANVPVMPVYLRLRANIAGSNADVETRSNTYSNVIKLPSVQATYVAPDATYPAQLYVNGASIQNGSSWKPVAPVYGLPGNYFTMVYVPDGGKIIWGTESGDKRGFNRLRSVTVKNADTQVTDAGDDDHSLTFSKGGWYTLLFTSEISADKKSIYFDLTVFPAHAYTIGNATGDWTDANPALEMTAPATADGQWVSQAFTAAGELRAYIKVPGFDWWRTEFTIYKGALFWRDRDLPEGWHYNADGKGIDPSYGVNCAVGQKLYVNFDANTGEVK
jgi:hypothetical protein